VGADESLYAYVYLDPANPPSEVMLQWHDGVDWQHRAYWGANLIPWGTEGTASRRYLGPLPPTGQWVRLEVPAALVGLEGKSLSGMAFALYDGKATWDRAGKGKAQKYYDAGNQRVAMRTGNTLRWLLCDHLGSTAYTVNGTTEAGEVRYKAFGATRFTSGTTPTTFRYTGQREEAALGLYFYGARWYDSALGHFIQPDTLVPDAGNPLDYHRYGYTRFNPLKYTDPTGHCAASEADPDASDCWRWAYTIYAHWDDTDYWNRMWPAGKDFFLEHIATGPIEGQVFKQWYHQYEQSDDYKAWAAQVPQQPISQASMADPMCAGDPACQTAVQAAQAPCNFWDCPGLAMDGGSLLISIGQSAAVTCIATTGPFCAAAAEYLTVLDTSLTTASTLYTLSQYPSGGSSEADLAITATDLYVTFKTASAPASSVPYIGVGYDTAMLLWGIVKPFVDRPQIVR
jgi:RHS repeat-associated protein